MARIPDFMVHLLLGDEQALEPGYLSITARHRKNKGSRSQEDPEVVRPATRNARSAG